MTKVNCPTCQKAVEWAPENVHRPFCCKKCQLIDLGEWATESHSIPVKLGRQSDLHIDPEDIEDLLMQTPDNFFKE
ncbi:DNA gyrase inhibitor YacG [Alteromonadaceae bacterium M269]|nr:DNA gyrase inhibitor YacG [Alteromonadaceae bacterium M269]